MAVAEAAGRRWWADLADRARRWLGEALAHVIAMTRRIAAAAGLAGGDDGSMSITGNSVKLPQWLTLYLIAQLITSIWWAATLQSDVRYLQMRNTELWQKLEAVQLIQGQYDKNLVKYDSGLDERVRRSVRETMDDFGYLRVRPQGQEGER